MYADMENWSEIRRRVLVEGVSRRQILRETGMHWRTLRKMLIGTWTDQIGSWKQMEGTWCDGERNDSLQQKLGNPRTGLAA
jgi:hypothetical protein